MIATSLDLAGLDGGTVTLAGDALAALDRQVAGPLLTAGDAGWPEAVHVWNGMAARTPALVVQPTSAADVAAALAFARTHRLLVSIKGGGHHIAGLALADRALTLDMSRMRDVVVDVCGKRAHVGAGCRLQDVDRATQRHGLATVLGFISEVGVAGLALGGGLGYLTRRFGWTADNLEEAELVTADGRRLIANAREHDDLFWALRGGGGNFGVVTRFTFRLHEVGPRAYGGLVAWPFERADEVLGAYRTITERAPRELSVWFECLFAPPAPFVPAEWHGRRVCAMAVCYTGAMEAAEDALRPVRALADPVVDLLAERPYVEIQSYLNATEPAGHHYYWKTEYLRDLPDALLARIRDLFAACEIPGLQIGTLHLAGALNERAPDDGAVGNRDARYAIGINGGWLPDDPRGGEYRQWIRDAWLAVRPFSTGGNYVNFQTADEDASRVRASYGANYDRLRAIKARYDPDNLFRVNRNIGR